MPGDQQRIQELRAEIEALQQGHPNRQTNVPTTTRAPEPKQDWSAKPLVWGAARTYEWTAPSGQRALLNRLKPEQLIKHGLLNKLNTLTVTTDRLVTKAEGQRPQPAISVEDVNTISGLLDLMQDLLPLLVAEPRLVRDPDNEDERKSDVLYVSDIELNDRIALMNEAVSALIPMEAFRSGSDQPS